MSDSTIEHKGLFVTVPRDQWDKLVGHADRLWKQVGVLEAERDALAAENAALRKLEDAVGWFNDPTTDDDLDVWVGQVLDAYTELSVFRRDLAADPAGAREGANDG